MLGDLLDASAERLVGVVGTADLVLVEILVVLVANVEKALAEAVAVVGRGDHANGEGVLQYVRILEVVGGEVGHFAAQAHHERVQLVDQELESGRGEAVVVDIVNQIQLNNMVM